MASVTEIAMSNGVTIGEVLDAKQAIIARLKDDNRLLREALLEYGHHKPRCDIDKCDCGIIYILDKTR